MKPIITVDGISKRYIIGKKESYGSLRDEVMDALSSPFRRVFKGQKAEEDPEVWALRDISFNVFEGDVLGIIGRNGAGKSTLLKILSRITEPTEGRIEMHGRIASLLEVGTGFHPELTGRENIYMNGALLGMSSREIKAKFDEIVAFSEIEKFLDTPVKRYSSGMYVRLAFAVAAHLEPEILIVDEVLAVGDSSFQKKCLGKMGEVAKGGRTVLFVSHNLSAVSELCTKAVLLSKGMVDSVGKPDDVIDYYLASAKSSSKREVITSKCERFELKMPYWINCDGKKVSSYQCGSDIVLRFEMNFLKPVPKINPGFAVRDIFGRRIFTSHLRDDPAFSFEKELSGKVILDTDLQLESLAPGRYEVVFGIRDEYEKTVIYSESELWLEIFSIGVSKNGADGILWHTSRWIMTEQENINERW